VTSADAAGLPIFPGLVRYDEVVEDGEIRHALRFTVRGDAAGLHHPATHYASSSTDPNLPPMGLRLRIEGVVQLRVVQRRGAGHLRGTQEVRHVRRRQRLGLVRDRRARCTLERQTRSAI